MCSTSIINADSRGDMKARGMGQTVFFLFLIFLLPGVIPLRGEVAVFPYRVAAVSKKLPQNAGRDYARLVAFALRVTRKVQVAEYRSVTADLHRSRIDYRTKITAADLERFAATGSYEYLLMGTLSRKGKQVQAKSLLYSVKEKRVLGRFTVRAGSLPRLALRETDEAFAGYGRRSFESSKTSLDCVLMVDMSAHMSREWPGLRRALQGSAARLIDEAGVDTRIYFIPFSQKYSYRNMARFDNSLLALKKHLARVNPRGPAGAVHFNEALNYSVKNISWRQGSRRVILVVGNAPLKGSRYPEQYGMAARKKNITIYAFLLGKLNHHTGEVFSRLAASSGGETIYLGYRKKVYDAQGHARWLYFERGRFFHARENDSSWRRGILTVNRYSPSYARPRIEAEEIYSDNPPKNPYSLAKLYDRLAGSRVIRSEALQNNVTSRLAEIFGKEGIVFNGGGSKKRFLISDGSLNLWIDAADETSEQLLEKKMKEGVYFPLVVRPLRDRNEIYGIRLVPLPLEMPSSDVPAALKVRLSALVKKSRHYLAGSGMKPNLWILSVKILQAKGESRGGDIRD